MFPIPRFCFSVCAFLPLPPRNQLPQDDFCHDITRLTGNDSTFARPVPSMWHSTTAHRPICQHNQKVIQHTEEKCAGGNYISDSCSKGGRAFTKTSRITMFRFTLPSGLRRKRTWTWRSLSRSAEYRISVV